MIYLISSKSNENKATNKRFDSPITIFEILEPKSRAEYIEGHLGVAQEKN